MLGQIDNPLESLKNAILQAIEQIGDEIWIPAETIVDLWDRSEFNKRYNRRLTDDECLYIAQQIRIFFEMDRNLDDRIWQQIKSIIGAKTNSIFRAIRMALVVIFVYAGYRIMTK